MTSEESSEGDHREFSLPVNSCTRQGLLAFFREMEECDNQYDAEYMPEEIREEWEEVYSNLSDIEGIKLVIEYDSE